MPWEVVYKNEEYGEGFCLSKVGIKTPDCHVIWFETRSILIYSPDENTRLAQMADYATEICRHMNSLERGEE